MSDLLQRRKSGYKLSLPLSVEKSVAEKGKWYEDTYAVLETLGHGSAGRVFRASRKTDGKEVALKLLEAPDAQTVRARREEFEILRNLRHPNIVEALDFVHGGAQAMIVLSFIEGSTLNGAVKASKNKCFSEAISRELFQKLLSAVNHMHSRRVVHRDIKAENIIISPEQTDLHLLDFNVAKLLEDGGAYTMTGTQQYASPEVLGGQSPAEKHDVWCTGLCLHIMMTGSLPHTFSSYRSVGDFGEALRSSPVNWTFAQWASASEESKDVVRECLALDMAYRPAPLLVLRMDWFKSTYELPIQQRTITHLETREEDEKKQPMLQVRSNTVGCGPE